MYEEHATSSDSFNYCFLSIQCPQNVAFVRQWLESFLRLAVAYCTAAAGLKSARWWMAPSSGRDCTVNAWLKLREMKKKRNWIDCIHIAACDTDELFHSRFSAPLRKQLYNKSMFCYLLLAFIAFDVLYVEMQLNVTASVPAKGVV